MNGRYVRRMIPAEPGDADQLKHSSGFPRRHLCAVDSCETAQESVAGAIVGYQNGYNAVQNVGNQGVQNVAKVLQCRGFWVLLQGTVQSDKEKGLLRSDEMKDVNANLHFSGLNCAASNRVIRLDKAPVMIQTDQLSVDQEGGEIKAATNLFETSKSLAKEADESLAKHKALELEIERLLRAVVTQDIMSIVQNPSVVDSSNLQTELERTEERFENAYNDMQQKIERLQDQLGDQKGKSKDTPCVSNTLDPLSQKLENENVELEFQVIAPGMFRINPFKHSRVEKYVPNKVRASIRTNPITILQPHVITKKDVNSDSNDLSSTKVDNTAKTKRPQPRSNKKNDRVPFVSKCSCSKNKEVKVEEYPRNLLLSKNKKHMSSECNTVKLAIQNDKSKVVCAMCKQCLITANHDVCVLNYVNDMNSRGKKQKANVSNTENQKKQKPKVMKPKKVRSNKRLASPKPSKLRSYLRWSPTGRLFDLKGKIIASSESES
ncbi:hypothetical protein Tco_1448068 [Tanacetum coccineum]